jgi:hypothetical protein
VRSKTKRKKALNSKKKLLFDLFRNDREYDDSYLKVELARRLLDEYPALKDNNVKRNEIRDHIISIVKKADQGKRKFLIFIDVNSATASLNDFHKFILSALLQCKISIFSSCCLSYYDLFIFSSKSCNG